MKRFLFSFFLVMFFITNAYANPLQVIVSCDDRVKIKDEIVSTMFGLETKSPISLKSANDYQVVFDQETQGVIASLFMNVRTFKKPVFRITFDTIPSGLNTQIRAQLMVIENPDTPNALEVRGNDKDVDPLLYSILNFVKGRVENRITLSMSQYIEQSKSKPQIGIVVANNAKIVKVIPKSLAEKAGIKKGDVILEIDDEQIQDNIEWQLFEKREKGHTLKLRLRRKSREWNVRIKL